MFPQNHAKLNKVSLSQTKELIQDCEDLLDASKAAFDLGTDFSFYMVYSQRIGDRLFYRILIIIKYVSPVAIVIDIGHVAYYLHFRNTPQSIDQTTSKPFDSFHL